MRSPYGVTSSRQLASAAHGGMKSLTGFHWTIDFTLSWLHHAGKHTACRLQSACRQPLCYFQEFDSKSCLQAKLPPTTTVPDPGEYESASGSVGSVQKQAGDVGKVTTTVRLTAAVLSTALTQCHHVSCNAAALETSMLQQQLKLQYSG